MKVRWTERAVSDALSIFDYIADRSEAYADSVYERILDRPIQLIEHPESGSIVPEYRRPDVRELFVHSFRIVYRIAGHEIRVLTVIHGAVSCHRMYLTLHSTLAACLQLVRRSPLSTMQWCSPSGLARQDDRGGPASDQLLPSRVHVARQAIESNTR